MWRLPWWWQKLRLICGYTCTRLHTITFQKTAVVIVTPLKIRNLTRPAQNIPLYIRICEHWNLSVIESLGTEFSFRCGQVPFLECIWSDPRDCKRVSAKRQISVMPWVRLRQVSLCIPAHAHACTAWFLPHHCNDAIKAKFIRLFIYQSLGVYPNSSKGAAIVGCKIIHIS
jgi:hypothetical protein